MEYNIANLFKRLLNNPSTNDRLAILNIMEEISHEIPNTLIGDINEKWKLLQNQINVFIKILSYRLVQDQEEYSSLSLNLGPTNPEDTAPQLLQSSELDGIKKILNAVNHFSSTNYPQSISFTAFGIAAKMLDIFDETVSATPFGTIYEPTRKSSILIQNIADVLSYYRDQKSQQQLDKELKYKVMAQLDFLSSRAPQKNSKMQESASHTTKSSGKVER